MPRLSVWMIRTALVYLVLGFGLGAVMLAFKVMLFTPVLIARLRPLHIELLTLGWTMNFALGVAYWILPRRASDGERGGETAVALASVMLNVGVLSVGFGQGSGASVAPLIGRVAEAAAAGTFALHAWSRVKPFGTGTGEPRSR
jgi:cbb3-type cytochrome oxidase subunit 1